MGSVETGDRPVFRFAPSPNGELHLGHALSALLNWDLARALGGRLLLRIEDIDLARTRERYVEAVLTDLAWLGIAFELPVRRQSAHFDDYRSAAGRLGERGLLYPCFATRAEIDRAAATFGDARDPDGAPLYPGLWKGAGREAVAAAIAAGRTPALRIDMAKALALVGGGAALVIPTFSPGAGTSHRLADPARWGDAVIVRKDVPASYHLAVVVDDALQGVTHVVRGADLEAATDLHRLLQALLGLPVPLYHHHRLIRDAGGQKLSKSLRHVGLRALREEGRTADDIRRMVGL
jgi:glutamyl-Q tRNA(Asp) synthetase